MDIVKDANGACISIVLIEHAFLYLQGDKGEAGAAGRDVSLLKPPFCHYASS